MVKESESPSGNSTGKGHGCVNGSAGDQVSIIAKTKKLKTLSMLHDVVIVFTFFILLNQILGAHLFTQY